MFRWRKEELSISTIVTQQALTMHPDEWVEPSHKCDWYLPIDRPQIENALHFTFQGVFLLSQKKWISMK